jgi:hypothetical protein
MTSRLAQKLRDRLLPAPAVTAGALLAAALATGLGIALTNAEGLVAKGFTTALSAPAGGKAGAPGSEALVAGTEEFWLAGPGRRGGASGRIEPAAWSAQSALGVAVGDKITIASGKSQRILEVVGVSELPASVTRIETDTAAAGSRQVLVTCRDTGGGQDGELVRFVSYAGPATTTTAEAKPPRAL